MLPWYCLDFEVIVLNWRVFKKLLKEMEAYMRKRKLNPLDDQYVHSEETAKPKAQLSFRAVFNYTQNWTFLPFILPFLNALETAYIEQTSRSFEYQVKRKDSINHSRLSKIINPLTIESIVNTPLPQLTQTLDWIKKRLHHFSIEQYTQLHKYGIFLWMCAEAWNHCLHDQVTFPFYWKAADLEQFPKKRQFPLQILDILFLKRNPFSPDTCQLSWLLKTLTHPKFENEAQEEIKLIAMSMAISELKPDSVCKDIRDCIKPVSQILRHGLSLVSGLAQLSWYSSNFPQFYDENDVEVIVNYLQVFSNLSLSEQNKWQHVTTIFLQLLINLKEIRINPEISSRLRTAIAKLKLLSFIKKAFLSDYFHKNYQIPVAEKEKKTIHGNLAELKTQVAPKILEAKKFTGKVESGLWLLLYEFLSMAEISLLARTAKYFDLQTHLWDKNSSANLNYLSSLTPKQGFLNSSLKSEFLILKQTMQWITKRMHCLTTPQWIFLKKWQKILWENAEIWYREPDSKDDEFFILRRDIGLQLIKLACLERMPLTSNNLFFDFLGTMFEKLKKPGSYKSLTLLAMKSVIAAIEVKVPLTQLDKFKVLLRPFLLGLAHFQNISIQNLENIHFIVQLFPQIFNETLIEKLIDHLNQSKVNFDQNQEFFSRVTYILLKIMSNDKLKLPSSSSHLRLQENIEIIISKVTPELRKKLVIKRNKIYARYDQIVLQKQKETKSQPIFESLIHTGSPLVKNNLSCSIQPIPDSAGISQHGKEGDNRNLRRGSSP